MLKVIEPSAEVFTHKLKFEVLMKDLNVRKMELHFNGWDDWDEMGCQPLHLAECFTSMISRGLQKNKNVIGWKKSMVNKKNKETVKFQPVILLPLVLSDDDQ